MPSVSRSQRKFFGWAEHNPEQAKAEGVYPTGMSKQQMHDYASTKDKGLPEHVSDKKARGVRVKLKITGRKR